jgi:hypothetical protein
MCKHFGYGKKYKLGISKTSTWEGPNGLPILIGNWMQNFKKLEYQQAQLCYINKIEN